jgi:hypothetical protein
MVRANLTTPRESIARNWLCAKRTAPEFLMTDYYRAAKPSVNASLSLNSLGVHVVESDLRHLPRPKN